MDEQNKKPLGDVYKELTSGENKEKYGVNHDMDESTAKGKLVNILGVVSVLDTTTVNNENVKYLRQAIRMNVDDKYVVDKGPVNYPELEQMSKTGDIGFATAFLSTLLKLSPNELKGFINNDLVQNWLAQNKDFSRHTDMTTLAKEALLSMPEFTEIQAAKKTEEVQIAKPQLINEDITKPEGEEK